MNNGDVREQMLDLMNRHGTGRDIVFGGHSRLRIHKGRAVPLLSACMPGHPDGVFPELTLEVGVEFLRQQYERLHNCTSLIAVLLNNVELGRDERGLAGEPDVRRKEAEMTFANYLLDQRAQWTIEGPPKESLAWFTIGTERFPFALESHFRSLMDRTITGLPKRSPMISVERTKDAELYYFVPDETRKYLVTSFAKTKSLNGFDPVPNGPTCNGTGCAGEVAILLRESARYRVPGGALFDPNLVVNIAPIVCYDPVNVGTEFAYGVFGIHFRTLNIFLDPNCSRMLTTIFSPSGERD